MFLRLMDSSLPLALEVFCAPRNPFLAFQTLAWLALGLVLRADFWHFSVSPQLIYFSFFPPNFGPVCSTVNVPVWMKEKVAWVLVQDVGSRKRQMAALLMGLLHLISQGEGPFHCQNFSKLIDFSF